MKKLIIIVFLYFIFAYSEGMSTDGLQPAIEKAPAKDKVETKPIVKKEKPVKPLVKEKAEDRPAESTGKVLKPTKRIPLKHIGEVDFRLGDLSVSRIGAKSDDIDEEDKVFEMDTLITGAESKCEVILNDGSVVRISENSKYVFESYSDTPNIAFVGNLLQGETWTNVNKADKNARDFKVKSPIAVAAVIGTSYRMTSDGKITEIAVRNGKVDVDLEQKVKTEYNIQPKKKSNSFAPKEVGGPKEVPGPYEVTLDEWISIVRGEVISVRYDGRYNKFKTDIQKLEADWEAFKASKR